MKIQQAVILAGGRGERLKPLTNKTPKPMIVVNGRPFLEYLISLLKNNNITDIVILTGYLHEQIEEHFKDGKAFGVNIRYSFSPVESDTGKRLKNAEELLDTAFMLLYGDNYWPLHVNLLLERYKELGKEALATVYTNFDRSTKNNMLVEDSGLVTKYDPLRSAKNLNGVNIGFFILQKKHIRSISKRHSSIEDAVVKPLIRKRELAAYFTSHRYYSLTDKKRIPLLEEFLRPKKIIFLDRDGVINKKARKADYIKKWEEFEFLPKVFESLQLLKKKGYEMYIITNQPGVARGMMTERDLTEIHINMKRDLSEHGISIKGIYACVHGWNEGCFCRKPNPGLLFQAASDHQINLYEACVIGDDERDILAGERAGCKTFLVRHNNTLYNIATKYL